MNVSDQIKKNLINERKKSLPEIQKLVKNGKIDGRLVEGIASNGLKFRGYLNESGEITNFYPILD